jgi:hypothetical protein
MRLKGASRAGASDNVAQLVSYPPIVRLVGSTLGKRYCMVDRGSTSPTAKPAGVILLGQTPLEPTDERCATTYRPVMPAHSVPIVVTHRPCPGSMSWLTKVTRRMVLIGARVMLAVSP